MDALGSDVARWAIGLLVVFTLIRWLHLLLTRPEYILGGDESDPPPFFPRLRHGRQCGARSPSARRRRRTNEGPATVEDVLTTRPARGEP